MTHRRSGQSISETRTNDSHQNALTHAANYITLPTDLLHMVEKLKIGYVTSWKWRRMSWRRNGQDVGLKISKTSAWIFMPYNAGRKH
jgi:hypothetical protein